MTRLARSHGVALVGLKGVPVDVQTHIGPGIVGTTLVGLPDASLRESKERVRAALFSCGIPSLNRRVTVNLSPADLPKAGSAFDLAIAVSMLAARGLIPACAIEDTVFVAELGLDGELTPVPGVLPSVVAAREAGFGRVLVPDVNRAEAELAGGISVSSCSHLKDLLMAFETSEPWQALHFLTDASPEPLFESHEGDVQEPASGGDDWGDLSDVRGQSEAVEALIVAAVGGHHLLLHGPAGAGKTMLAAKLPHILPILDHGEALAVTALRSLAYSSTAEERVTKLVTTPPFEAPHHSATMVSLVGGGNPIRPGAISLAHGGVLMLDEAPEFPRKVLDSLRQPLDSAEVTIHRAQNRAVFPARFQLVLTANPCPCGGDGGTASGECQCQPLRVRQYRSRLSGPLLDRVDLMVHMGLPTPAQLAQDPPPSSSLVRQKVTSARERTRRRLEDTPWKLNAEVSGSYLRQGAGSSRTFVRELERTVTKGSLSFRGADRILRLAWSFADLEERREPADEDYQRAMAYRGITRGENSWI